MSRARTVIAFMILGSALSVQAASYALEQPVIEEARATDNQGYSSVPVTVFRLLQTYFRNPNRASNQPAEQAAPVAADDPNSAAPTNQRPIAQFASNAASTVSNAVQTVFRYLSPVLMVAFPFLIPLLIGGGAAAARNFDLDALNRVDWGRYSDLAGRVQNAIHELRQAWEDEDYSY